MTDYPDVSAELFSITAGPFGCIITFSKIQPTGEPGQHPDPTEPVVRLRLSPVAAKALAEQLQSIVAQAAAGDLGTKTISH
jgi:hypothetical protein